MAVPVFKPAFAPDEIFDVDKPFSSKLVRIIKHPRRVLTATTTSTQTLVSGLDPKLSSVDMGFGVGDLHALDWSLFYFNLRENASERLRAYQSQNTCMVPAEAGSSGSSSSSMRKSSYR